MNEPKAMTKPEQKSSLQFFSLLNELLQFAPTDPSEIGSKDRVAKVGLGDWLTFDGAELLPDIKTAIELGMADAWADISVTLQKINAGEVTPGECYGTRDNTLKTTTSTAPRVLCWAATHSLKKR